MNWQKITMPPSAGDLVPEVGPLVMAFTNIYKEKLKPKGFCIFFVVSPEQRTFYLSPIAADLCREYVDRLDKPYEASPCDIPPVLLSDLRVGDSNCLDLLK